MFLYLFASPFPWGDVISGTAGLINGIFNSAATGRANKRNIQFAKESQQEQERFAKEMFNMENEYNSPEAVMQRLAAAGINPNAYWSQTSGTAGMASGDSSVSPVTPNIQPVPSPIQGLVGSSPFESIMKLKEIRKMESETKRQDIENEYLGDWYSSQIASNEARAALDKADKKLRDIDAKWLDKSKKAELRKYQNEAYYFAEAGKNQKAQAALNKWKEKFEKWHLEEYAPQMLNDIKAGIKLVQEKVNTEKSAQFKNRAEAGEANARAGLISSEKWAQDFENDVLRIVGKDDSVASKRNELAKKIQDFEVGESTKKQIDYYCDLLSKENDNYKIKLYSGILIGLLGAAAKAAPLAK